MANLRAKRKPKKGSALSLYDLIDWYCPRYFEFHPESTPQSGAFLEICGLLDGRYKWQVVQTRDQFNNGAPCYWRIGSVSSQACATFADAKALAQAALQSMRLPEWKY